jgi:molecular chaperone DnaK
VLIPRNTGLPAVAKRLFKTQRSDQHSVLVQIVEGESRSPDGCSSIGRCVVGDLPAGLPTGAPIEVQFRYSSDGRLAIAVRIVDTQQQLEYELQRDNGLTGPELDSWRSRITTR